MSPTNRESGLCNDCHGDDLEVIGIRDICRPPRLGEALSATRRVVARRVDWRCRLCGCDGFVLRRVEGGEPA